MNALLRILGLSIGLGIMIFAAFGHVITFDVFGSFMFGVYVFLTGIPLHVSFGDRKVGKEV